MQIRIFNVAFTDNGESLAELNKFLAVQKVMEVEQHFFQNEKGACWCFCVRYISANINSFNTANSKQKVDYKELLNEKEFAVFSKLRECRKTIAASDAVPAYAVFTDEELAEMTRFPELELSKLIGIKGIGDKKVSKYGTQLIELFNTKPTENETTG
ncbi:MAG: HRDC domain-containing protein [Paludibacter sp.]